MTYPRKNLSLLNKVYLDESLPEGLKEEIYQRLELEKQRVAIEKKKKIAALTFTYSILFLVIAAQNRNFKAFASEIPFFGEFISVITGEAFFYNKEEAAIAITVPLIEEEQTVYKELNRMYLKEGKSAYQQSLNEIEAMSNQQIDITDHYNILVNDEKFLVIEQSLEKIIGSSMVANRFDTIDKQNEVVLSLPMLFKNVNYRKYLSEEVTKQMKGRMAENTDTIYWPVEDCGVYTMVDDPAFYINNAHDLVLCFDKYEVAPGYMGAQEFTIHKEFLEQLLINKDYLGLVTPQ